MLLQLLRAGSSAGALLLLGSGLGVTFDHQEDGVLTYFLLYGVAGLLVLGIIGTTVAIERRKEGAEPARDQGVDSPQQAAYVAPGNIVLPQESPGEIRAREEIIRRKAREPVARRLAEGTALLQMLRGSEPDLAAALEQDVEEWLRETQETLRGDLLARFDHRVSRAVGKAMQDSQRAYPRLEATLVEGTDVLHEFLAAAS